MTSDTPYTSHGEVLVGLSSPALTALSGSASLSKHMGYMRIKIAHAPVEWFQHVFPSGPLQSCMVTWAGLDPSNDWVYVLNRHFSDTIFGTFFSLGIRWTSVPIES